VLKHEQDPDLKNRHTKYVAQRTKKKDKIGNTRKCGRLYIFTETDVWFRKKCAVHKRCT